MVLREHLRSVRTRKQDFDSPKDYVKYYVLRLFVLFVFVLSHLYDYISYPIYFVIYHPWLVRRYKRENHARLEVRDDCVLYHSLEEPTPINKEVQENNLTTMDAIFDYVSCDRLGLQKRLGLPPPDEQIHALLAISFLTKLFI